MKSISATGGILILTVFLSLSAPAYAGTVNPYPVYGYVNYTDGTPADGELVTIYKDGDPLNNITAEVGSSYDVSGWWKADLYNIPVSVTDGDTIVVEVLGESKTRVVDTSLKDQKNQIFSASVTPTPPATSNDGDDNGGSSRRGGGGGSGGTYPPGWGEGAPSPAATSASAAAPEPIVAPTKAATPAQTKAPTKAPTVTATETTTTTTEMKTEGTPGFGAVSTVFAIAGLLVAAYLVMRRRE